MSSIKANTELLTDPIKMQNFRLQNLLIEEQKSKWKTTLISFILGIITALGTVFLSNMLSESKEQLNGELLLNTITKQAETIQTLTTENIDLKVNLKNVISSSEINK